MKKLLILFLSLILFFPVWSQKKWNYPTDTTHYEDTLVYQNKRFYDVPVFVSPDPCDHTKVRNVILLIGDGMGVGHVYAGLMANKGNLFITRCPVTGFSKTYSASGLITDSAAGGTALATGHKTRNGVISLDADMKPVKSILELAEDAGLATGMVVTCKIEHATPAVFVAHEKSRSMYEAIAADLMNTGIDVFIGGGLGEFLHRRDGRNLVSELKEKGYQVITTPDSLQYADRSRKLAGLVDEGHLPAYVLGRGDYLPKATELAIEILSKNKKGFFLMVEGSQIDWAGHNNHTPYLVTEMLDFDRAVGKALEFAARDKHTLVIITADHETGGIALTGGNISKGYVEARYCSEEHTAVMVPVFAFGPGACELGGVQDNTEIFHDMMRALGLEK
jgi:alkaline phosphatase